MGETVKLATTDGNQISAYVARPQSAGKAGLVVVQEIFGVNSHIRSVTDRFAGAGGLQHRAPQRFLGAAQLRLDLGQPIPKVAQTVRHLGQLLLAELAHAQFDLSD